MIEFDLTALLNTKDGMETTQRNGAKQDDGTDTFTGVPWFVFAGIAAENIYVNGNNWVGFGANTAQLHVCNRDGATWYVYRQTGICNGWNFLKLRVEGYAVYSSTDESYAVQYEIFLFGNKNMFLNVIKAPTSASYQGVSKLVCGAVTLPLTITTPTPISFYALDDTGSTWDVRYEQMVLLPPFAVRYLLRAENSLYTWAEGQLIPLAQTELTAETFRTSSAQEAPPGALLLPLPSPSLLYWQDSDYTLPIITATVSATPYPQTLTTHSIDMSDSSIKGVQSAEVVCTDGVLFAMSFQTATAGDGHVFDVWIAHDGAQWVTVTEPNAGMTGAQLSRIGVDAWAEVATTGHYKLRFYLPAAESSVTGVTVNYIN